jgi:hypothetical protein
MSNSHRRFILGEQGVGSAIFNFALNGTLAWLGYRMLTEVPLWGLQSIGADTVSTSFMLPFMTCLVVTRIAQWQVRSGRLPAMGWRRIVHPTLRRLPFNIVWRAVVLGAFGLAVSVPTIGVLVALGVRQLSLWDFIAFKATFAAVLAGIVTPIIALCALGDEPAVIQS